jgi:hypothetical protein
VSPPSSDQSKQPPAVDSEKKVMVWTTPEGAQKFFMTKAQHEELKTTNYLNGYFDQGKIQGQSASYVIIDDPHEPGREKLIEDDTSDTDAIDLTQELGTT